MGDLSKHFSKSEFKCSCGKCVLPSIDKELVEVLEKVRVWANSPLTITSGYRCPEHNQRVGGASRSKHLLGNAADIIIRGKTPEQVFNFLNEAYPDKLGLAFKKHSFVHVDTYGNRARRWTY